jgi:hypothetical protein
MKYRHIFWAFILIALGTLFILNNIGILEFGWRALWSLWPLILILWGISILPIRDWIKTTALVVVLAFTIIFFNRLTERSSRMFFDRHYDYYDGDWNTDDEESDTSFNYKDQALSVPYDSLSTKGILRLDAAAGNFSLAGVTSDFLSFNKTGDIGNYSLTTTDAAGVKKIDLSMEKTRIRRSVKENRVDIMLNQQPAWNLDFDIGAADIKLDLRDYRIDTTTIDAGASSIDIKIGEKNPLTVMTFNAGASSIKVDIPTASGCQIKSESFMVSKEFDGFDKKGEGIYQTTNFNTSKNKIYITIKTAISKIEINRY